MIRKISREPGKFLNNLDIFWMFWKVFRQPGKFQDSQDSLQMVPKISGQPGYFPDSPDSLLQKRFTHTFLSQKLCIFFVTKRIYSYFFCRENDLRTSSGKFLCVESCHPESSDFSGLCPSHPIPTPHTALKTTSHELR